MAEVDGRWRVRPSGDWNVCVERVTLPVIVYADGATLKTLGRQAITVELIRID